MQVTWSKEKAIESVESFVLRVAFGLMLMIPACLIVTGLIYMFGGPLFGTGIMFGIPLVAGCWILGDLLIAMIGKDKFKND